MKNKIIKLIRAFRTDENTVMVTYHFMIPEKKFTEFTVEWTNISQTEPDEIEDQYYLCDGSHDIKCNNKEISAFILAAIHLGEEGSDELDGLDIDLYLEIRDTFGAHDCEELV